ncbi:MAG: hypothetical protein DPW16_22605, partial [Chloroflexi bacterium]|nr:hypothetical protein [Chloroflexota bacterium]
MLKGLDDVQWLDWTTPDFRDINSRLIRDLASPDARIRMNSLEALRNRIFHQNSIYKSSVQAVPFLIELLTVDSVEDKHGIMDLLRNFAGPHLPHYEDLGERLRAAVLQGYPVYTQLLDHDDPRIRLRALWLMLDCAETFEEKVAHVRAVLATETVPEVIGPALRNLASLLSERPQAERLAGEAYFREYLDRRVSPDVKIAAIVALFEIFGEDNSPPDILEAFYQQMRISHEMGCPESLYGFGFLEGFFSLPKRVEILLRLIYEAPSEGGIRYQLYEILVWLAFGSRAELLVRGQPTPEQHTVLLALAREYDLWGSDWVAYQFGCVHPFGILENSGLPTELRRLLKFIETGGVSSEIGLPPTNDKDYFGLELAEFLARKTREHHPFPYRKFVTNIVARVGPLDADERVQVFAEEMQAALPADYPTALEILLKVFDATP